MYTNFHIQAPDLDLQLDDVFIRVLDRDENIANLPVIPEPPANIPAPPPQRGRRRVGLAALNPHPFPGREERHRRRQAQVDAQRQNNRDRDAALQQENQAAREENEVQGLNPEAPAARMVILCVICSRNAIDCFLQCGHPYCTQCITTLRNLNNPNPSLCPRCRAPFREATRIFF
jgi:hypothetical protein